MLRISLILLLFATSCSPEQRIARILKKNPNLIKKDTVYRTDTTIIKEVQRDTTFFYNSPDTITIVKDKLEIQYFYNTKDSTVYINGKCKTDTIYKSYPVYINSVSVAKHLTWKEKIKLWIFGNILWIGLVLIILVYLYRKTIKAIFPFLKFL